MESDMTEWIPARIAKLGAALLASAALLAAATTSASAQVIYDNLPSPLPGNVVSEPFQAAQVAQFGGLVEFTGAARTGALVTVMMSSWGCESGSWTSTPECKTAKGAEFSWPVTLNVNAVGPGNAVGPLIASLTKQFTMPYRPSQNDKKCKNEHGEPTGAWYDTVSKECSHGKEFRITFGLGKLTLPNEAILSIAYNTSDYGAEPQRSKSPACEASSGGCPYDSLNVGVTNPPDEKAPTPVAPSVGTDPLPESAYQNTGYAPYYCDKGAGGTGTFRLDEGCWTGYQPLFEVRAQ
jgi:hypothetical protein